MNDHRTRDLKTIVGGTLLAWGVVILCLAPLGLAVLCRLMILADNGPWR